MLPALGAASLTLDAVQSLTSPAASSSTRPGEAFGSGVPEIADSSPASSPNPTTVSGFGGAQISPDNLNTLLNAQSVTPAGFASAIGAGDSISDSSQTPSVSASSAAASTYNAANQLTQSTALPLGLSPFSVSA